VHSTPMSDQAKEVIESAREATKSVIAMGRGVAPRVLRTCDHTWRTNANTLASNPAVISQKLKDDLISLPGQVTLIVGYFANRMADNTEPVVNYVADVANSTVNAFAPKVERRASKRTRAAA